VEPKHRKLRAGKRAFKTFASVLKNDFVKGLVELITNCDESYCILERDGKHASGLIRIWIERHPKTVRTKVRVLDQAEGMNENKLDAVMDYGEDTSGHVGRGIFGMGLKDTINAYGHGKIFSFYDGNLNSVSLENYIDLTIHPSRPAIPSDRRRLGIESNGTCVEVVVSNKEIRTPSHEKLRQNLQQNVCLRKIIEDPNRRIVLEDARGAKDEILYKEPDHEVLFDRDIEIDGFPSLKAHLRLCRAKGEEELSYDPFYGSGGILITSQRAVHEATLCGYENDPYASKLFGELECPEIYKLQELGESVVSRGRTGLEKTHPFSKALLTCLKRILTDFIEKEKEKAQLQEQQKLDAETRKKHREALDYLNKIAKSELELVLPPGPGEGPVKRPPGEPNAHIFEFAPDHYRIVIAEKTKLSLAMTLGELVRRGAQIAILSDNDGIRVLTPQIEVPLGQPSQQQKVAVVVEGIQVGAIGTITAQLGESLSATATVVVVASKRETPPHPPKGALFKEIRYEPCGTPHPRSYYEEKNSSIVINTDSPSISLYFGASGEGRDQPQNQALLAELVTFEACKLIARKKASERPLVGDLFEYFLYEITNLQAKHSPFIHKIFVDRKYWKPE
jgi:hypothetical protein